MINEKSIAVLPFENLSSDPENEYFSDGMTEEVINALSKIEGLKVTARTSSFVFKNQKKDIRHIGNELGVSLVLEGSVRKAGKRVRITAQLIRSDNGFHIWSENYDRELKDIFELQDEISLIIADKIRENFGHIYIEDQLVTPQTTNIEAYELFLRGRFLFFSWNLFDIERAISYFHRATEIEPQYDQPYYGASLCYSLLGSWGHLEKAVAFSKAEQYLRKGASLGKESVGQKFAEAVYQFWGYWNYTSAHENLQIAHQLNPQDPEPMDFLAEINRSIGDFKTALEWNSKALEVNPLSTNVYFTRSTLYALQMDFDMALSSIERGLSLDPKFELLRQLKISCLIQLGREEELNNYCEKDLKTSLLYKIAPLLYALFHQREANQNEIQAVLQEIAQLDSPSLYPWDLYLSIYNGEPDQALALLEEKVQAKMGQVINFKSDPLLSPIRGEKRFQRLVEQSFPAPSFALVKTDPASSKNEILSSLDADKYTRLLRLQMEEEQVYLDHSLSLRSLAESIDLHPNKLSWLINEKVGKNFNNYVNSYRLQAFQEKSLDPANSHYTILGLAYESGFNSKSVFNDFFKKSTGQTPKAWLKAAKKS